MARSDILLRDDNVRLVQEVDVVSDGNADPTVTFDPKPPEIEIGSDDQGQARQASLVISGADPSRRSQAQVQPSIEVREYDESDNSVMQNSGVEIHPYAIDLAEGKLDNAGRVETDDLDANTADVDERLELGFTFDSARDDDPPEHHPGKINVKGGFGDTSGQFDSVTIEGAPSGKEPAGGNVTVHDHTENATIEMRGEQGALHLGYSYFESGEMEEYTVNGQSVTRYDPPELGGRQGRLVLDDGDPTGLIALVKAEEGRFEIRGAGANKPMLELDPGAKEVRIPADWSFEAKL